MMNDQELIQAVAEEVMGAERVHLRSRPITFCAVTKKYWVEVDANHVFPFEPLTDANHWMMVVERIKELKLDIDISWSSDEKWGNKKWEVEICNPELRNKNCYELGDDRLSYIDDDSIGRAVCLAALKAVRGK